MRFSGRSSLYPTFVVASLLLSASYVAAQAAPSDLPNLSTISSDVSSSAAASSTSGASQSTNTNSDASTITSAPTTTGGLNGLPALSTASEYDGISNAPKLSGAYSYPAPTVPPTSTAPFMQKSSLPSGTVFICVGAVLGFFAFVVLAWRGAVAWSLHRSVRRAANGDQKYGRVHGGEGHKRMFQPFYTHTANSSLSMEKLNPSGKATTGGKGHKATNSNLFFSPTAGTGMHTPANRASGYLPAGYYAAGTSAPANGAGATTVGAGSRLSALADLGPQRQGHARPQSYGPSPPRSPSLGPSRDLERARMSSAGLSTIGNANSSMGNLNAPAPGVAPSAYLEDLFDAIPQDVERRRY
ncbi:hypothetical protein MMC19_002742 [Ptychographa xylographoides]|nr:hypothetical protein [Ptychographa xylographoides]